MLFSLIKTSAIHCFFLLILLFFLFDFSTSKIGDLVKSMVGNKLITKQTPKDGILVQKVMVAQSVDILRETYFCILMDR